MATFEVNGPDPGLLRVIGQDLVDKGYRPVGTIAYSIGTCPICGVPHTNCTGNEAQHGEDQAHRASIERDRIAAFRDAFRRADRGADGSDGEDDASGDSGSGAGAELPGDGGDAGASGGDGEGVAPDSPLRRIDDVERGQRRDSDYVSFG